MFNLFGSTKKQEKVNNYPAVVEEIHNEFLSAGDRMLEEANEILAAAPAVSIEKGRRLAALGFDKVPEVVNAKETESKIAMSKELAGLIQHYKIRYPNNKFITEYAVKKICEKYGLVCGDVSMYKGFVPENKLKQIESFKLKKEDVPGKVLMGSKHKIDGFDTSEYDVVLEYVNSEQFNGYAKQKDAFIIASGRPEYSYVNEKSLIDKYLGKWGYVKAVNFDSTLQICAPLKDMEIPRGKEVKGYKIQNIPDPVVLQPVNGGYLILAAWGDEASDELVVNETQN